MRTDRQLAQWENKHGGCVPIPPKPKKRDNEESRMQQCLVRWFDANCKQWGIVPKALFKISNDGMRSPALGKIMKAEGLRSGVSDLFLAAARGPFHGFFLEMKKPDGVVSDAQREFMNDMHDGHYHVRVAYSVEESMKYILEYLKL